MSLYSMFCKIYLFICSFFYNLLNIYNQKLYDELNLTLIFDDADAIQEYEKQALAKSENLDADKILADSLENLGYVRKLEVLHGINEFKKSLSDFLREKANNNGLLTAEDVKKFFSNLQEKRQEQQRTMFMPPDNCKFQIDLLLINMNLSTVFFLFFHSNTKTRKKSISDNEMQRLLFFDR